MLPRRQSIFHLGEEGGASAVHHRVSVVAASSSSSMATGGARRARDRERLVVGLQILVHHHHHHHHGRHGHGHAHAHAANVVLKQMVRPRAVAAAAGSRHGGHALSYSFLKACFLCKRELRHDKDVYMYRGDQGFCSEECRWQQILVDEAREREAAAVMSKQAELQRRAQGQARHHSPHPTPVRGRPPTRKTLAVA